MEKIRALGGHCDYANTENDERPGWLEQQIRSRLGRDYIDHVERVMFLGDDLGDNDLAVLEDIPGLRNLSLSWEAITDAGMVHVSRLSALESIHLEGTLVTRRGARSVKRAIPGCRVYLYDGENELESLSHWTAYDMSQLSTLTPLHEAAKRGDVEAIEWDLAAGAPVDTRVGEVNPRDDLKGATPLMLAAARGQVEAVRRLIGAGADVNASTDRGMTPLMAAAGAIRTRFGDPERCAELLLEAGADPLLVDGNSQTAYDYACARCEPFDFLPNSWLPPELREQDSLAEREFRPGIRLCFGFPGRELEPRKTRARHGDAARLRLLLNAQPYDGVELLQDAMECADAERVQMLFEHSSLEQLDWIGQLNILHSAAKHGDAQMFALVFAVWPRTDPPLLTLAAGSREDATEKVRLLLKAGADPNHQGEELHPLMQSLLRDGTAAAALIDAGAELPVSKHAEAIYLAAKDAPADVLAKLLSNSPLVRSKHTLDQAIVAACGSNRDANEKVSLLLKAGANVNASFADSEGRSALLLAAAAGQMDAVVTLALAGADVHASDEYGNTALLLVAGRGDGAVLSRQKGGAAARALLEQGARQDVRNRHGYTAWSVARVINHQEVLELLEPQPETER